MNYQKSPLPYLSLLISIICLAIYSISTIDKQIDQPLVYTIENASKNEVLVDRVEKSIQKDPSYAAIIGK